MKKTISVLATAAFLAITSLAISTSADAAKFNGKKWAACTKKNKAHFASPGYLFIMNDCYAGRR